MGRREASLVVCLVLLLVAFAGCAEDSTGKDRAVAKRVPPTRAALPNMTAIEERIDERLASGGETTLADWFVLVSTAGPDGVASGYRWTIPAGSVTGMRYCCTTGVILEIAPIVVGGATIDSWCILAFRMAEGKAVLVGVTEAGILGTSTAPLPNDPDKPSRRWGNHCETTEDRVLRDPLQGDNSSSVPANVAPNYMFLQDTKLEDLANLYFVLGAKSDVEADFGLAFRVLPQYPAGYSPTLASSPSRPAPDLDAFLVNVTGLTPHSVPRMGTGPGFNANFWRADHGLGAGRQATAGTYEANSKGFDGPASALDAHPAGAVWNFNLSSSLDAPAGWSFVYGDYKSYCGTGRYVASADLHGNPFIARSVIAQHLICGGIYGGVPGLLLFGQSSYMFAGGGQGGGTVNYELTVAGALFERVEFHHVAFATPLDVLLKIPASPARFMDGGVAGNVPP